MSPSGRPIRSAPTDGAFDRELASAARSLIVGPLPGGVLDLARPIAQRSSRRFEAPLAAAVAIAVVAIGLALAAPKGPGAGHGAAFRAGSEISDGLRGSGFACRPGASASPGQPRMEAIVCKNATTPVSAVVIVSEDPAGGVGEVHVDSSLAGSPTAATDRDRIAQLRSLVGVPFADPSDAAAVRVWLTGALPLDPGRTVGTTIAGKPIVVARVTVGNYVVVIGDLHVGPSAAPSLAPPG